MRQQREQEDLWDKYEDFCLKSSLDKSNYKKFDLDKSNSNKNNIMTEYNMIVRDYLIKKNKKENNTFEDLKDSDEEIQLKDKKPVFNSLWKLEADDYLWQTQRCDLKRIKRKKRNKSTKIQF